ncbi:MAG: ABC transporter permease, partial [Lachnospiraceae bacterium]|nr:ABC transporter permease [Lachnospiraceae bacterium]
FQVLRAVVMALFGQAYHFEFSFSLGAAGLTVVYFVLIYLHALRKNRKKIRTMKIHELIYFDRQNEGAVISKSKGRRWVFSASIVLGIVGTFLLMTKALFLGVLGAGFVIAFLYGFFLSFASGVPAFFDKRPARKYRGQNLLVFRTLTAKLGTMGIVMATISLLFTAMLISEGTGLVFSGLMNGRAAEDGAFDLYVGSASEGGVSEEYLNYIEENILVLESFQYPIYQGADADIMNYVSSRVEYYNLNYNRDVLMGYQDYATLRKILGYKEVELLPGQCLIHCRAYLKDILEDYGSCVRVGEETLTLQGIYTEHFNQNDWGVGNGRGFLIIVPDEVLKDCTVRHWAYVAKTAKPVPDEVYAALRDIRDGLYEDRMKVEENYDSISSKAYEKAEAAAFIALTVFPLYFLALALLMTAATILTIQQLSEAKHYRQQFLLLDKLGMERQEMKRALLKQFSLYYLMPAIPPVLIGVPMLWNLANATEPGILVGMNSPLMIVGSSLVLFLLVYVVYIAIAYTSLKKDVLPE